MKPPGSGLEITVAELLHIGAKVPEGVHVGRVVAEKCVRVDDVEGSSTPIGFRLSRTISWHPLAHSAVGGC